MTKRSPPNGDFFELSAGGYQFPDTEDPRQRFSWHMVEGCARTGAEHWDFRWQALTCTESGRLVSWLHAAAERRVRVGTERAKVVRAHRRHNPSHLLHLNMMNPDKSPVARTEQSAAPDSVMIGRSRADSVR